MIERLLIPGGDFPEYRECETASETREATMAVIKHLKLAWPLATMDGTDHCGRRRYAVQGARARVGRGLLCVGSSDFANLELAAPNSVH